MLTRAPRVSQAEYEALAGFRYALRQFLRFSEEAGRVAGLKPQQYLALLTLRGFRGGKGLSIGELAERLQVRHHSAVGLVDRLASLGLVRREEGRDDRRRVYVKLTPRGSAKLLRVAMANRGELQRIRSRFQLLLRILKTDMRAK
ncbi:MAG TPA: MarR family transcriptional regulator [Vicinamibacteria bacterium]|jgi:DNA-binding MarR family transcriptional regulator|nr:MarR family transcriptional regulator [Vicinamibacteria bacterium]